MSYDISTSLHLHLATLDYVAAFIAGSAILALPKQMANILFFPGMAPSNIVIFTLQLFAFMLIVFASHFAYHIHYTIITKDKMIAMLWMLFVGDLLHLLVYYRGAYEYDLFPGGLWNPGVWPNVVISSYAAVSRLVFLFCVKDRGLREKMRRKRSLD